MQAHYFAARTIFHDHHKAAWNGVGVPKPRRPAELKSGEDPHCCRLADILLNERDHRKAYWQELKNDRSIRQRQPDGTASVLRGRVLKRGAACGGAPGLWGQPRIRLAAWRGVAPAIRLPEIGRAAFISRATLPLRLAFNFASPFATPQRHVKKLRSSRSPNLRRRYH